VAYGIASVLTPPQNRKHGYARHMMRLLHWLLARQDMLPPDFPVDEWGQPPERREDLGMGQGLFSVLYSDVGPFYGSCGMLPNTKGWEIQGNLSFIWDIDRTDSQPPTLESSSWKWLDLDGIGNPDLWDQDTMQMRQLLPSQVKPGQVGFAYLSNNGMENYQRLRLVYLLDRWMKNPIYHWGIQSSITSSFISWTVELQDDMSVNMVISRLRADQADFKEMVTRIKQMAQKHQISRIEVWSLDEHLRDSAKDTGAIELTRTYHLPAVKWYAKERAEPQWLFNER
jgi:hypothetical protein